MSRGNKILAALLVLSSLTTQAAQAQPSYAPAPNSPEPGLRERMIGDAATVLFFCYVAGAAVCESIVGLNPGPSGDSSGAAPSGSGLSDDQGVYERNTQPAGGDSGLGLPDSPFKFYSPPN